MKIALKLLCSTLTFLTHGRAIGQAPALPDPFGPHQWTTTVKVAGEDSNPIAGADVAVSYDVPATPTADQPRFGEIKGLTDGNGMFSTSHTDRSLGLAIIVQKPGYYVTRTGHQFLRAVAGIGKTERRFNGRINATGIGRFFQRME
jgi:hypothetical protein